MDVIKHYQKIFCNSFDGQVFLKEPKELYAPIDYALSGGGKRLRPVLTIMICDFYGKNYMDAIDPAIAIEIFHNFTLVHDDIMDNAPIRRGRPTVFKKWDANVAILSGDTMFAKAYEYVTHTRVDKLPEVLKVFTKTAMEVCEGQQYDMNFESLDNVCLEEYLDMIRLKTAVLMAASLKIGAILGSATPEQADLIYNFGEQVGMVFQLQDDLLDTFGTETSFGKKVGGDILDCKKTYLYIKTIESLSSQKRIDFISLYHNRLLESEDKINKVRQIMKEAGVINACRDLMNDFHNRSLFSLQQLSLSDYHKTILHDFAESLLVRNV